MSKTSPSLADTLLEAHVKHEMSALKGAKLKKFIDNEVDELLDHAGSVTLNRLVSADQVMGVIQRIVVDMELDAGIPELAAEMATEVMNASVQSDTTPAISCLVNRPAGSSKKPWSYVTNGSALLPKSWRTRSTRSWCPTWSTTVWSITSMKTT